MSKPIILSAYALLGLALLVVAAVVKRRGRSLFGRPPIHPAAYALGKASLIAAVCFLAVHASGVDLSFRPVPPLLARIALGVFLAGDLLAAVALATLGTRTKMGVGEDDGSLQTGGVYRLSRNPMYLGLYLVCAGGCLYTLNPACLALTLAGIAVHHRIILAEERFLKGRFGEAWDRYAARVRRYL
jgi:protein-S-isoprenylcysteine O-methyltransferase Ste14